MSSHAQQLPEQRGLRLDKETRQAWANGILIDPPLSLHQYRLLEALWRESLHLINDGVATTADIDDAMRFGAGIRFSYMGQMMIYHIAGGDAGMHHFMAQFGPALKLPWTKLEAPELTQDLINKVADGTTAQAKGRSVKELERYRNDCIIEVMEAIARVKKKYGMQPGD